MALHNIARMFSTTTGTGTVTLGQAVPGFLTFAQAGVTNGETVSYGISDGTNQEVGHGTYTASGTTLARTTVLASTNSGSAISLSGNNEQVYLTMLAQDIAISNTGAVLVPTTGFSITLSANNTCINPAGTLATGTITMPASPNDQSVYRVTSTQQITAVTWSGNGNTMVGAPTFLSPGTPASFMYNLASTSWYPT